MIGRRENPQSRHHSAGLLMSAIAAATLTGAVCGQSFGPLTFHPAQLDFGHVRESDGKATGTVTAVNTSADTTFIISAKTSCGCSGVEYSDTPIAPGDSTEIRVTYDPANRPGRFLKSIKIYTGEERISNTLKLRGNVIPSSENLDKVYPDKAGTLRLTAALLNAGELRGDESRVLFVGIYNDSGKPIALTGDSDSDAVSVRVLPDTVEPFGVTTATIAMKAGRLPEKTKDFNLNAYIINATDGDTIVRIPVGGAIAQTGGTAK